MNTKLTKLTHLIAVSAVLFFGLTLILSSCVKIEEGSPGRSFISLTWNVTPPTNIDAGTSALPRHFAYNQFYPIEPGRYHLYYEGTEYYQGTYYDYAWDMDYDIWVNPAGPHGYDGADTHFTLELNPYGPESLGSAKAVKTGITGYHVVEYGPKKVVLERTTNNIGIRITYSKANPR